MAEYYFKISPTLKNSWQEQSDSVNKFYARQTIAGDWVCSVNTIEEFPDAFVGQTIGLVTLATTDFPVVGGLPT